MINVMLVDDDPLVRLGLADLIGSDARLRLVAQAADGRQAVEHVRAHRVDVILMDLRMPVMDGVTATRTICAMPDPPKIVVLTTFDLDEHVYDALTAGASGFLLKDTDPDAILQAVHTVAAGGGVLDPSAARRVIARFQQRDVRDVAAARRAVEQLTPRERDVLVQIATGASNATIAEVLGMRESTVKAHVSRILQRLEVDNRVQATLMARSAGLTDGW